MNNIISSNLDSIKKRHYAQKATTSDYWVAFYESQIDKYKAQFGEDFNLIIYGKEDEPYDFISIPYNQLSDFLTDEHLDERNRRWVFSIDGDKLRVHRNIKRLDIREYRGNLVDIPELYQYGSINELNQLKKDKEIQFEKAAEQISQEDLERKIRLLDRAARFREGTVKYYQRKAIVAEYAKRRANGICQLCLQRAPFIDKRERPYLEAHHVIWLSQSGNDIPENTAAVCPNCHRKMHVLNIDSDRERILSIISRSA
jgi:hypothetical protein